MKPKYPAVKVVLVGKNGNVFNLLAICRLAMLKAGLPESEWKAFHSEATATNYDGALQAMMRWFDVH